MSPFKSAIAAAGLACAMTSAIAGDPFVLTLEGLADSAPVGNFLAGLGFVRRRKAS